jgi:hypothetical protein
VAEDPFWLTYKDTAPEKLAAMSDETLDACHRYFLDLHPGLSGRVHEPRRLAAEGRIALLKAEIDRRRVENQTERHHGQVMKQGKDTLEVSSDTLCWTKVAAIAAIGGVLIGLIALAYQIASSRNPPVLTATPSPASSPQTTATISESRARAVNSNTATPSPSPTAETESTTPP